MLLVLQTANVTADAKNCVYPNRVEVTSAEELKEAVRFDHVCGEFTKNYRNISNFVKSNVIVMDCDNDHSDNPEDWITFEKLEELFDDISYAAAPSRHHMIEKDGKAARPKFHVYFQIEETDDAGHYAAIKRAIHKTYPFFDGNALDAARFIFGADAGEVVWHKGWLTIDEEVDPEEDAFDEEEESRYVGGSIVQGSRNKTLSHFAGRALKRFGETEKAKQVFLDEAAKCDPPLEKEELKTIWYSALKFFRNKVKSQPGYVAPDEYNADFDAGSLKPDDYSDIGQAKKLVQEYGEELRYSDATDYLRYNGDAWIEDKQLAVGAMEEFLDLQLADAYDYVETAEKALLNAGVSAEAVKAGGKALDKEMTDDNMKLIFMLKAAKTYLAFVMKRRDYKYVVSALNAAKPMLAVKVSDLDKNELLLNTPYATYDLSKGMTGEQPHNPDDLITKLTNVSPSEDGKDIWEQCLELFFSGDKELINYVQMVVGMAAVGKVYQEHLIIAYGGGANGKSTFWNTISRVLGTYSGKLSAETLTVGCKRNVKPEMAELKGKRLIIASEMEEGMRLNTAVVKQLCSTDEIFAEKKYKAPFAFTPSHTLVLYTNHLPKVGANDDGIWRRLIVIPFNAKITGSSDIKNYSDYLYEKAGGYILQWIIEGAKKAIDAQFKTTLPTCVQAAIKAYREDNDWLGHFINECCDVDPSFTEKSGELYQKYREYAAQNGEFTRQNGDFNSALENAGFSKRKTNKGAFIYGLKLKEGQDFL